MLDYQKPDDIALAACRLRSLACAAEIMLTESPLTDQLESQSIGGYLLGLAYEIAIEISEAADQASARNRKSHPD